MKKVRYAVVGAGWISQEAFLPGVWQTENSVVSAIVTGSEDKGRKLADFHQVPHVFGYEQYAQMLNEDICDAVYVALPNSMHAEYTIQAARAGKHILVEKPLAVSLQEGKSMIEAAEENDVYLMTAYRLHSEPGTVEALERIRRGEIGEPRIFNSILSFRIQPENHRLQSSLWGGPLQDLGVYCINAARHLFEAEPTEVWACCNERTDNPLFNEVEESIAATMIFPGGRIAQFIASFGADTCDSYTVVGTAGSLTMDPAYRFESAMRLQQRNQEVIKSDQFPYTDHFAGMTAYFSECILNENPPEADGLEGLADLAILLAIEKSAQTGNPQKIELPVRLVHPNAEMIYRYPRSEKKLLL